MSWDEIANDPSFQALPAERQGNIRQNYFSTNIAPNVPPERMDEVRESFLGPPPAPTLSQRISQASPMVKNAASKVLGGLGAIGRRVAGAGKAVVDAGIFAPAAAASSIFNSSLTTEPNPGDPQGIGDLISRAWSTPLPLLGALKNKVDAYSEAIPESAGEAAAQLNLPELIQDAIRTKTAEIGLAGQMLPIPATGADAAIMAAAGPAENLITEAAPKIIPALGQPVDYAYNAIKYRLGLPTDTGMAPVSPAAQAIEGQISPALAARQVPAIKEAMLAERMVKPGEPISAGTPTAADLAPAPKPGQGIIQEQGAERALADVAANPEGAVKPAPAVPQSLGVPPANVPAAPIPVKAGEPSPPGTSISPSETAPAGQTPAPAGRGPLPQSITQHPAFVKAMDQARPVLEKYASQFGEKADDPHFAVRLYREVHDDLHQIVDVVKANLTKITPAEREEMSKLVDQRASEELALGRAAKMTTDPAWLDYYTKKDAGIQAPPGIDPIRASEKFLSPAPRAPESTAIERRVGIEPVMGPPRDPFHGRTMIDVSDSLDNVDKLPSTISLVKSGEIDPDILAVIKRRMPGQYDVWQKKIQEFEIYRRNGNKTAQAWLDRNVPSVVLQRDLMNLINPEAARKSEARWPTESMGTEKLPEYTDEQKDVLREHYQKESERDMRLRGYSSTPVLDLARKMKLSKKSLEENRHMGDLVNAKGRGIFSRTGGMGLSDFTRLAYQDGLIPEHDDNMALDAIDHELRMGKPRFMQMAPKQQVEEPSAAPRPGQEGGFNVPPGGNPPVGPAAAPGEPPRPPGQRSGQQVVDELTAMKNRPIEQKSLAEVAAEKQRQMEQNFFDHTAPVKWLDAKVEEIAGRQLLPNERAHLLVSLFPGVKGQMEYYANYKFQPIVAAIEKAGLDKPFDDTLLLENFIKTEKILTLRAQEGLASGEPARAAEAKELFDRVAQNKANPRGINTEEAQRALAEIEKQVGPKKWAYIEQQKTKLYRGTRELVTRLRDLGAISPEGFKKIESYGLDYVPRDVLDYIDDGFAGTSPGNLSRRYQNVLQSLEGTTRDVRAALPALFNKWMQAVVSAERQVIYNAVRGYADMPGMDKTVFVIPKGQRVPEGFEPYYGFKKGRQEVLAVPEGVGSVLSNMGKREQNLLNSLLSNAVAAFKAGTTHLNLAFIGPHSLRFTKDFAMLAKTGLKSASPVEIARFSADIMRGAFHVISKDKVFQDALMSKALYSTFSETSNPELFIKGMQPKSIEREAFDAVSKIIPSIVRAMDNSLKVASQIRGQRMGMDPLELAAETRKYGGAPDYAMHGKLMPELNQLFTYLNVRSQLSYRQVQAAGRDPGRMAFILSTLAAAAALRYFFNHRDQKTGEQYDQLPASERARKNIYMLGKDYETHQKAKQPMGVTIPRTELEAFVGIGVDALLDHARRVAGRSLIDSMINSFTSLTPTPLHIETTKAPAGTGAKGKVLLGAEQAGKSMAAQLNPALRAPMELLPEAGHDTFRDKPLISPSVMERQPYARANATTTQTAQELAKLTASPSGPGGNLRGGISPVKIERAVELAGGGVAKGVLDASDAIQRRMGIAPPSQLKGYEAASRLPGLSRFMLHAPEGADIKDQVVTAAKEGRMDAETAKALFSRAVQQNAASPSLANKEGIKQAAIAVARVDPKLLSEAVKSTIRDMTRQGRAQDAFDTFEQIPIRSRMLIIRQWMQTPDGRALRDELFHEMIRRRASPPETEAQP